MSQLAHDSYGKSKVRLARVFRSGDRHEFLEASFNIQLEGQFETAFTDPTNEPVLPTDTMKNTVYCIAKKYSTAQIEELSLALAQHFLSTQKHITKATINVTQTVWNRAVIDGQEHDHAFLRGGSGEKRTCSVTATKGAETVVCGGVEDLVVLKTTQSGFEGFIRDPYTTLPDVRDRIFATNVKGTWRFSTTRGVDFQRVYEASRAALIATFAGPARGGVYSPSVQYTLYRMGQAVLAASPALADCGLSLPNLHCIPFNLAPMGMTNDNEIFIATDEPHGSINATVCRGRAPPRFHARM